MKEIKFRAKPRDLAHEQFPHKFEKKNKDFVYGTGIYKDSVNTWLILENKENKSFCDLDKSIIDETTLGEYTGLKDKNNVEMYEGDIFKDWLGKLSIIVWVEYKWKFEAIGEYFKYRADFYNVGEVIGNVFDNPELL